MNGIPESQDDNSETFQSSDKTFQTTDTTLQSTDKTEVTAQLLAASVYAAFALTVIR